ncbi:hypothetical protein NDU88_000073 [Pleurodeles waltl]|uniref:Uncharacterized protein n=1 Tax=Pleurodeles waltl TaxID=8319 RepID=A0AAV7S6R3_PLEWA|nr:hypothetical protein NDU88_000073 [Pleurodeles waltl]
MEVGACGQRKHEGRCLVVPPDNPLAHDACTTHSVPAKRVWDHEISMCNGAGGRVVRSLIHETMASGLMVSVESSSRAPHQEGTALFRRWRCGRAHLCVHQGYCRAAQPGESMPSLQAPSPQGHQRGSTVVRTGSHGVPRAHRGRPTSPHGVCGAAAQVRTPTAAWLPSTATGT